jgi:hypothetical protein
VKQYFYGPSGNLFPHSFDVPFSEVKDRIYKIGNLENIIFIASPFYLFQDQYGTRILLTPKGRRFNLLLFILNDLQIGTADVSWYFEEDPGSGMGK